MRVVIAVNNAEAADRIVAGALHYGISDKDEIAVVTVTKSPGKIAWFLFPETLVAEVSRLGDEDAKSTLREAGLFLRSELHTPHVTEFMLDGDVADQLKQFVDDWKADLLIIGYSEKMPWPDDATHITERMPCPVLVVGKHKHDETLKEPKQRQKIWHEPSYII